MIFLLLIFKLKFFRVAGLSPRLIAIVFGIKVLAGVGLSMIYTHYYPDRTKADIYKYFDDSAIMYEALEESPEDFFRMLFSTGNDNPHFDQYYRKMNNWYREYESNLYNDSHTIIRFNAALRIFSRGYYNVHTVFMCFLSLIGLVALFKALSRFFTGRKGPLILAVFLLPSVIFWGSGVLKEGLLLMGLGLLVYHLFALLHRKEKGLATPPWWWSIPVILFCLFLLFHLKFYVIMALIPGMIAYVLVVKTGPRFILLKYLAVGAVCVVSALNLHHIHPEFDAVKLLMQKQHDFIRLAEFEASGSSLDLTPLEPNISSFISMMPEALLNSTLRPLPHRIGSPFHVLPLLENLLMLGLLILALAYRRRENIPWNAILFCGTFVLILFTVIGWTTPVVGAIVRYKVPALPFLAILLFLLMDTDRLHHQLSKKLPRLFKAP